MRKISVLLLALALCVMTSFSYAQAAIAQGSSALAGCPVGKDQNREVMLNKYLAGEKANEAKDYSKAFPLIKAAAEAGNPNAQYSLGLMYDFGYDGLPVDHQEANVWYLKAAQQGNDDAQFNLAISYQQGEGIAPDMKMSVCWAAQAALNGDQDAWGLLNEYAEEYPDAQYILSQIYRYGTKLHHIPRLYPHEEDNIEIEADLANYKVWLERAAANRQPDALKELGK